MKWITYIFLLLSALYVIFCAALYFNQEKIFFFPDPISADYKPWKGQEIWIPTHDNLRLNAALITTPNPKGAILYLHGNKGNVKRCLAQTTQFENLGYDVLVPDYRSYGKSEGVLRSEKQMYQDVQTIYAFLKTKYSNIVVIGYSLGSGMAAYVAAQNEVAGLILVAPFKSLVDMKKRYIPYVPNFLLKYPFRTDQLLAKTQAPIAIIHGKADELIPYESSLELKEMYPQAQLYGLPNVNHRRVIFDQAINRAFRDMLK